MEKLDLKVLGEKIVDTIINQDQYLFAKEIPEFKQGDKLVGDWFSYLMCDPTTTIPTFYEVTSPYDLVSKKAPQHALVFHDGKCIFQTDYTDYVAVRTGILDSILISRLGVKSLADKKVLICGAGRIASWSLQGLKAYFPDLNEVTYFTKGTSNHGFEELANSIGVKAIHTSDGNPSLYDMIFCHTSAEQSIFKDPSLIKQGAILTGFISSTKYGEFDDPFYNSEEANILIDWNQNLFRMAWIERQIEAGEVDKTKVGDLCGWFKGDYKIDPAKKYTIFTSVGTPMQNIALLKILVEKVKTKS